MKIYWNPGFEKARNVLRLLRQQPLADVEDIFVNAYRNGRENGYALQLSGPTVDRTTLVRLEVLVAENRSSDRYVGYFGQTDIFGRLTDTMWEHAVYSSDAAVIARAAAERWRWQVARARGETSAPLEAICMCRRCERARRGGAEAIMERRWLRSMPTG